jgi:hypothetical protein
VQSQLIQVIEQYTVPKAVYAELAKTRTVPGRTGPSEEEMRTLLQKGLEGAGWIQSGSRDSDPVFIRDYVLPLESRWWPVRTTNELQIPTPQFEYCNKLVANDDSKLTVVAPLHLLGATFPAASSREDMLDGREQLVLPTTTRIVRLEVVTPLARNQVAASLVSFSFGSVAKWLALLIAAIFKDEIKDALTPMVRRILQLLHLRKKTEAGINATSGDERRGAGPS